MFARYSKAIAAFLGAIAPGVLIWIAHLAGFTVSPDTAVTLLALLPPVVSLGATVWAPANAAKSPPAPPAAPPAPAAPQAAPPASPAAPPAPPAPPAAPPAPPASPVVS